MRKSGHLKALATLVEGGGDPGEIADWTGVVELACATMTAARLALRLEEKAFQGVPPEFADFLADVLDRNRLRNERMLAQLEEAASALNGVGVAPMLQKGAALMLTSAHARAGRINSDIDLIAPRGEFRAAVRALTDIGYAPFDETISMAGDNPLPLMRTEDVGMIDLHSAPRGPSRLAEAAGASGHVHETTIGAARIRLPSPSVQVVHLTLHDQHHDLDYLRGHFDLRHAVDIAELVATQEGVDWALIEEIFDDPYSRRAFATQMLAISRILNIDAYPAAEKSTAARLQAGRKLLQMDAPFLAPLLTCATAVAEFRPLHSGTSDASLGDAVSRAGKRVRRLFRQSAGSKL